MVISKRIYKINYVSYGKIIDRYKEKLMARWFSQKEGGDYEEMFSLIFGYTSVSTIINVTYV